MESTLPLPQGLLLSWSTRGLRYPGWLFCHFQKCPKCHLIRLSDVFKLMHVAQERGTQECEGRTHIRASLGGRLLRIQSFGNFPLLRARTPEPEDWEGHVTLAHGDPEPGTAVEAGLEKQLHDA